jgi:polar amino acid transport system substrate-binding protein
MYARSSFRLTATLAALSTGIATQALAAPLVVYFEERPPLMSREGHELSGMEGIRATLILKRMGAAYELREAPVVRQVALIEKNAEAACAIGLYRTAEREKVGKYSQAIYSSPPQGLLIRADGRISSAAENLTSILANPVIVIVLRNGYSYGAAMDSALAKARARIIRTLDDSLHRARMVINGMADGTLFTAEEADALRKQLGDDGAVLALRHYPDTPPGAGRHLFCSRRVPDSTLQALDSAISSLH